MLKSLHIKNFTAFSDAKFNFAPGLNVIIGANGTGKSHLLKLAYSVAKTSYRLRSQHGQSKAVWQKAIADDLVAIFRPDSLGRLARRQQGASRAEVAVTFEKPKEANFAFRFSTKSTTEVQLKDTAPTKFAPAAPIFVPTKELLSLFPGLLGLYETYQLSIDETYPDLCLRLNKPMLKGPRSETAKVLQELEDMAGGEVKQENGRFYLYQKDGGRLEMDLVAEGLRKLATLSFLLKNGSLNATTALFWDEPEANLNPKLIRQLAKMLIILSKENYQIVLATHSLFLLKELHILSKTQGAKVRYFGLSTGDKNATDVTKEDDLESLPDITSLEAELDQTDRFADALHESDENDQRG